MILFKKAKRRIGFVYADGGAYFNTMASTRLRCLDVMNYFKRDGEYVVEQYRTGVKFDIVIFQKCFDEQCQKLAKQIKESGCKVILDINVNYIERFGKGLELVLETQQQNIKKMLGLVDAVITSSQKLEEIYTKHHQKVYCIEENVQDIFFSVKKQHKADDEIKLVYCGYSVKAKELFLIADIIKKLEEKFSIKLLIISEEDPKIDIIPYIFERYNQRIIHKQLIAGSIKVAPRAIEDSYNIGHSFTKVAYPLAVGLPVVASPMPSYINRGVLLCNNNKEWHDTLEKLIVDAELRNYYGGIGREFVKNNFSISKIGNQYRRLFDYLLNTNRKENFL